MSSRIPVSDYRGLRAMQATSMIMHIIDRYIADECRNRAFRALEEAFIEAGIEVLTDEHRRKLHLPPRDSLGWTEEELKAWDALRLSCLQPMPFYSPKIEDGSHV
jgi:hypothetical protein